MSRYLLDTNVLSLLLTDNVEDESTKEVYEIINYTGQLVTSSICISELSTLLKNGDIKPKTKLKRGDIVNIIEDEFFVKILPFCKEQASTHSKLETKEGHNDPTDHNIISHAITNKLTVISSDEKFGFYKKQGLNFIHNKESKKTKYK